MIHSININLMNIVEVKEIPKRSNLILDKDLFDPMVMENIILGDILD